jgi:hypothetical protein
MHIYFLLMVTLTFAAGLANTFKDTALREDKIVMVVR